MFCGQCGSQNPDDARFCANCGEVLNAAPAPEPVAPPKKSKKGLLFIIGGAVLALALVLTLIFVLGGGHGAKSPEALGKKFVKAIEKGDGKAMLALIHKDVIEADVDEEEMIEDFEDYVEEMQDYCLKFKFKGVEEMDEDDLEEVIEFYDEEYGLKVKDAAVLIFSVEMLGFGEEIEMYAVKIGSKWYLAEY